MIALRSESLTSQMPEYVRDDTVRKFALWNPHDLGYLAAYATKSLITREIKGDDGDKFTAGKLGKDNIVQFKF